MVSEGQLTVAEKVARGIVVDAKRNRQNQIDNFFSIGIPLAGSCIALALLPWMQPAKEVMFLFGAWLVFTTLGTTIGMHRYFTHRGYKTSKPIRFVLAFFATIAMQGSILRWVADHRRHHRFTDKPGDLHTPYFDSNGAPIPNLAKGLLHAHIGWMFTGSMSEESRYAPDLLKDPIAMWVSKYYWPINIVFLVTCGIIGFFATGELMQCLLAICYAGCLRVTLIHQFTWAVNSIGHTFGTRVAGSTDKSTNNLLLTFLTIGDGLHSSHHENPVRSVNPPAYLDMAGTFLIVLEKLGLVWELRR